MNLIVICKKIMRHDTPACPSVPGAQARPSHGGTLKYRC